VNEGTPPIKAEAEAPIPPDSILLGSGELWKVPLIPGGSSEKHKKLLKLSFEITMAARDSVAIDKKIKLDKEDAKEIEDPAEREAAMEDIETREIRSGQSWLCVQMSAGFEFIRALYEITNGILLDEEEAQRLFPVTMLRNQMIKAHGLSIRGAQAIVAAEDSDF